MPSIIYNAGVYVAYSYIIMVVSVTIKLLNALIYNQITVGSKHTI